MAENWQATEASLNAGAEPRRLANLDPRERAQLVALTGMSEAALAAALDESSAIADTYDADALADEMEGLADKY